MASFGTAFKNGLFFTLFGIIPIVLVAYFELLKQGLYLAPMYNGAYGWQSIIPHMILVSVIQFVIVGLTLGTMLFKYISDTVEAGLTYE